jgi:hypothetical protein
MCEDAGRDASSVAFDRHYGADELDNGLTHDLETLTQGQSMGKARFSGYNADMIKQIRGSTI